MKAKRPDSHEQSDVDRPKQLDESIDADVAEANVEVHKLRKPDGSYVIPGEILRELIEKQPTHSIFYTLSTNPLLVVVVGGLIGGVLTGYYTLEQKQIEHNRIIQQQELARQQIFSDEVNKLRLQKLGEVWEQLDEDEFAINRLLDDGRFKPNKESSSKTKRMQDITILIHNDQAMVSRYRYWLGEDLFQKTTGYLNMSINYALNKLGSPLGTDLSELMKKRDDAKQDILKIRQVLEREPGSQSTRVDK